MNSDQPMLRIEHLTKRFGGLTAVDDVSFAVRTNEIVGLIGPNGAGKSTTFDLISGFRPPTSGQLFFRGENITRRKPFVMSRRGLVRTFQHASFFSHMTVYDNVLMGVVNALPDTFSRERRIREVLKLVELEDVERSPASALPHGRQRMLSIAIALGSSPRLLCLDEPLTGLNMSEVAVAMRAITRLREEHGTSIVLVDHNMRAVMQVCDRIVVLNYGKLLAEGSPQQVRANTEVVKAYLGIEA